MDECALYSLSAHSVEYSPETSIRPKRMLAPRREVSKSSASIVTVIDTKNSRDVASKGQDNVAKDSIVQPHNMPTIAKETREDASITALSNSGSITHTFDDENLDVQIDQTKPDIGGKDMSSCHFESQRIDGQKKVQFSIGTVAPSLGNIPILILILLVLISMILWHLCV